jgi:hypothetical protein
MLQKYRDIIPILNLENYSIPLNKFYTVFFLSISICLKSLLYQKKNFKIKLCLLDNT